MAARKIYTVATQRGLNLRETPSKEARVLRVLEPGEKISVDNAAEVPEGWKALQAGGFVMSEFLK